MNDQAGKSTETSTSLEGYLGKDVVLDVVSQYIFLGTLAAEDERFFVLVDADVHDLRESGNTREFYLVESKQQGITVNRKKVMVRREEVICISALEEVVH